MLPAGSKDDLCKLCVTVEGVDAFLARSAVTITIRVSTGTAASCHTGDDDDDDDGSADGGVKL